MNYLFLIKLLKIDLYNYFIIEIKLYFNKILDIYKLISQPS